MNDVLSALARLSPERRRLLEQRARPAGGASPRAPIPRRSGEGGAHPLSFAQQRLWFVDQLLPGCAAYNLARAIRLTGPLDVPALRAALGGVVRRHQALRTVFASAGGEAVQRVLPAGPAALPCVDLSGLPEPRRGGVLAALAREEAARPMSLARGPLFRAALVRLRPGEHALLYTLHHIVGDGWSLGILLRELAESYAARVEGRPPVLPELPVQYADFAAWQREWLSGERLAAQLAYWSGRLADVPALELPADRRRPPVPSHRGAAEPFTVPPEAASALRALAAAESATPFMLLLAALKTLLHRYTGEEDVVVASGVSNRYGPETEPLIGCFINILLLRTELGGDPSFRALLRRVREVAAGAYAHDDLPFEKLVEELRIARDPGQTPLFQVMLVFLSAPGEAASLPGLLVEPVEAEIPTAQFDWTMHAWDEGEGLAGVLNYSTDLFDRGTIRSVLDHFVNLLRGIAARPDARLSDLPLLGPGERRRLAVEPNATAAAFPDDARLHDFFEAWAARAPGSVAVLAGAERTTYAELDARANRLARHLRGLGVGPEVRVGVCVERGVEMVVALLAILKAGGAYVPMDAGYPPRHLAFMLEDARVAVLVTQAPLLAGLPEGAAGAVVRLDADRGRIAAESPAPLESAAGPENAAYVIYTSGSTGTPKGIVVRHRGVVNNVTDLNRRFEVGPGDSGLALSSLSFDMCVYEVFGMLAAGGTIVLPDPAGARDVRHWAELLVRHGVTVWNSAPALLEALVELVEPRPELRPRSVRLALLGGDWIPVTLPERLRALAERVRVISLGGATEASIHSTIYPVEARDPRWTSIPYGRPMANQTAFVLDRLHGLLPVGVAGELYLGGAGLARGYLGRPELTADRFVPDPFGAGPGGRLYRTGDRARWRADGQLELLGRMDFQVKVRGFRIELGEIEAALRARPGVRDAVVMARGDSSGDRRLVGYVVGEPGAAPSAAELREALGRTLPEYMVPSAIVALERLPLTPNGKVDRGSLPAPELAAPAAAHVAPRTPAEELLAGIWADVLRRERVGVGESFFELGGHSLLATRVVSRIREAFGVELPLRAVFEAPTLERLAARVEALRAGEAGPAAPPLVPVGRAGRLPLSFAQERLWFLEQLSPGGRAYTIPGAVRLEGPLDVGALERALGEVVRRHEALRTRFPGEAGHPWQEVVPPGPFPLRVETVRADGVEARARAEVERPFDLERGPLLRALLLRVDAAEHVLVLAMHHAVSDGWSLGVLFREWSALYAAYARGEASPLEEPPVQYGDYAAWQRAWLRGEALEAQLAYWRGRLAGAPVLELPADHARPAAQDFRGATHALALGAAETEGVRTLARREGATLYMVLLGALQVLLGRYADTEDVVVGSPIAGRTRREVEGLIGLFVNTLALRTDLSGDPTFREVVGRVREAALGAYAHQETPFERVVEEVKVERDLGRTPLVQVMFALHNTPDEALELEGVRAGWLELEADTAKFDLSVSAREHGAELHLELRYRTDLFEAGTMRRLGEHLGRVLAAAAAEPERRIGALELLGAGEREQVLREWNATRAEYDREATAHGLFEAQAARTPEAVAVEGGGEAVTYRELDARASRLAERLRARGVGPEARVGVCVERGTGVPAALLGVLKAGGAYVPLDPGYPRERLAYLAADAGVQVVVATAQTAPLLPELGAETVLLEGADGPAGPRPRASAPAPSADNLAYVVHTSGSTGAPKGVMVRHRGVVNLVQAQAATYGAGPGERILQFAPLSFDASAAEIFIALCSGATLVAEPGAPVPGPELVELLRARRITNAKLTPSALAVLPEAELPALHTLLVGGEPCPAELVSRWGGGGRRVFNVYGPTETTVRATTALCSPGGGRPPIGPPLRNTRACVLDRAMEPVPVGVPGELFVGGDGVARGYLGRPALTAERFVPDPFGGAGERLYRTGDRVRWLPAGELEYLGRTDEQLKLRGFRIEPGEVEAALLAEPGVSEAAVAVREDAPGDRRLVAYVVGEAEGSALRARLGARLPEHLVPAAVVTLERLPLTPNGKLDRRALPAPEWGGPGGEHEAPRTATEELLAELWAETLGIARVGVRDDFFDLGGYSLLAVRLVARVQERMRLRIPVATLFRRPTVAELARAIDEHRVAAAPSPVVAIRPDGSRPPFFCVHPAGGHVFRFVRLARLLGPEQPFFGLQAPGLDGEREPFSDVGDMALFYVGELRRARPRGPYLLGGWSVGGLVAWEIARQLRAAGDEVALLAMFDTRGVGPGEAPDHAGVLLRKVGAFLPPRFSPAELAGLDPVAQVDRLIELAARPGGAPAPLLAAMRVYRGHAVARRDFATAADRLRVTLFQPREEPADRLRDARGFWGALAGEGVEVHPVPGDHDSMFEDPHVGPLADALGACLEAALRRG